MRKTIALLILCVLVFIASCKEPPKTTALPAAELVDLEGKKVTLTSFAGKPVILNFWATWCGPCRMEIPMLNELHAKYEKDGLVIMGVSTDEDGASAVRLFNK